MPSSEEMIIELEERIRQLGGRRHWQQECMKARERADRLEAALRPFAVIGEALVIAGRAAMPDDVSARFLRLDGITAATFRQAHVAVAGDPVTAEWKKIS